MRTAIFSDIHEDIVSLRQAIHKADKLKCNEFICLGDISGFSAPHYNYYDTRNASECLNLIKNKCSIIIAGNHDMYAASIAPTINPEFEYPKNWYEYDYHKKLEISKGNVWLYDNDELNPLYKKTDIDFIKTLPEKYIYSVANSKILFTHYCYPNTSGSMKKFYNYIEDFKEHRAFIQQNDCNYSFVGHRHFAGLLIAAKTRIIGYRYGKKHKLMQGDCIFTPAIAQNNGGNGFCIFDSINNTVEAIRI